MSRDERLALMKTAVLPEMKKDFQAFSAKEFASFSCETCHGSGTKQGKFDMPNPELPKLDANGGFKRAVAKRPDMLKFMEHTVVPHMADILGLPQWEQSHATGFGCGNCHAMN